MKRWRLPLVPPVGILLFLGLVSSGAAQVNRVFVSARSGNDANSCANVNTPCQTFQGAVNQLNPNGEAIVLDSGGYGPVTITQGVTIEAPPGVLAFIHPPGAGQDAVTVNAGSARVVIRGLTLNAGTSFGILVTAAGAVHVENCVINGFLHGIFFGANGRLFVKDTISRSNSGSGIMVSGNGSASLDHCRLEDNAGDGLHVTGATSSSVATTIRDSVVAGNNRGIVAFGNGNNATINVENTLVANSVGDGVISHGQLAGGGALLSISNSTIINNVGIGLFQSVCCLGNSVLLSRSNNTVTGNGAATQGTITALPGI